MTLIPFENEVVSCVSAVLRWGPEFLFKVTALAGIVLFAGVVVGRTRPALRHLITSVGLVCLLLLGLLSLGNAGAGLLPQGALTLWGIVTGVLLLRFLADLLHLFWRGMFAAREAGPELNLRAAALASRMGVGQNVRVRLGRAGEIPHTWGVLHPVIILPPAAQTWAAEQVDAVLLHELGHIRRGDVLCNLITQLTVLAYWFHPLAWLMWRRVRRDAERACDALVVEQGMPAAHYARHLLSIVRDARRRPHPVAATMAAEPDLAGRIRALLDPRLRRHGSRADARVGRLTALVLTVALVGSTLLMAGQNTSARKRDTWLADLAACLTVPQESSLTSQDPAEEVASVSPEY